MGIFDTKIKRDSRHRLRKAIKRNFQFREKLRILCLGGAEALEIFEVYDALKIPRKNIVIVERVRSIYDEIVSLDLGCEVYYSTVLDYLKSHPNEKFDVVSLDYMGHLGTFVEDLALVRQRHIFEKCLIHTNFCMRREKYRTKVAYMYFNKMLPSSEDLELSELRGILSNALLEIYTRGKCEDMAPLLKNEVPWEKWLKKWEKHYKQIQKISLKKDKEFYTIFFKIHSLVVGSMLDLDFNFCSEKLHEKLKILAKFCLKEVDPERIMLQEPGAVAIPKEKIEYVKELDGVFYYFEVRKKRSRAVSVVLLL